MKKNISSSIVAALVIAGLATFSGCSSGSDESSLTSVSASTGTFVDSEVEGLNYTGPSYTGLTDEDGSYDYVVGETIEFSLGDLVLGSLIGSDEPVSPIDFFGGTDISDQRVINLLVLLQSLDTDGNATNGIEILPETVSAFEDALLAIPLVLADVDLATLPNTTLKTALDATAITISTLSVPTEEEAIAHYEETLYGLQPPVSNITGTSLKCGDSSTLASSALAKDYNASETLKVNVSSTSLSDANRTNATSHNAPDRLDVIVDRLSSDGTPIIGLSKVHPLVLTYTQQIKGEYETGDGSADIGDPTQVDGVFFALSLDDGLTWKNTTISDSTVKSSMDVVWDLDANATKISYPGHAQKPSMAIEGNNILVAWNDKYCPKSDPHALVAANAADYFAVNGTQGSIDYANIADPRAAYVAPNDKLVYEVPFSCVWTAQGTFDTSTNKVKWNHPLQLTTGARDSNHIWVEGSEAGFAMTWQEDTEGLRQGEGEGPGEGWSGATTNHGSDIWYSSIKMDDFGLGDNKNFHYPVRITDNESCTKDDPKAYCQYLCDTYGTKTVATSSGKTKEQCKTYDVDMLENSQAVLDGDTGASRPALTILKTNTDEFAVVLGYEETKGLSNKTLNAENNETNIGLEGKSVYFESFLFSAIDAFVVENNTTIQDVAMPLVSAGNIVNVKAPKEGSPEVMQYENARRLVIGTQIDSCDATNAADYKFAFMYKQSFETQGSSSDMFIRLNDGFTYDSFVAQSDRNVTNISAQTPIEVTDPADYNVTWTDANLDDNTYDHGNDNTFSPRIFLRGNDIYTGYEYTPNDAQAQLGNMPSNFHTHIYMNGVWLPPVNVTQVVKGSATTVDARFFSTPKGGASTLNSDLSNPNVLFVTWGEIDFVDDTNATTQAEFGKAETNLYYKRALYTDSAWVWDAAPQTLAAENGGVIQEKEVESFTNPDGKTIYNVWLQEEEDYNATNPLSGTDSWFGRVDYNISK